MQRVAARTLPARALLRRELLTALRKPALFIMLFIAAAALLIPVTANAYFQLMRGAWEFYNILGLAILFGGAALATGVAASSLTVERERDTFELLRTTLVTPGQLVWAKLANAVGVFLVFFIGLLPLLSLVYSESGMHYPTQAWIAATILAAVYASAACGVFASAYNRTTAHAITAAYMLFLFVMGLHVVVVTTIVVAVANMNSSTPVVLGAYSWPARLIPALTISHIFSGVRTGDSAAPTIGYLLILGTLFMMIAHRRIARAARYDDEPAVKSSRTLWRKAGRPIIDKARELPSGINPVVWSEWLSAKRSAARSGYARFAMYLVPFLAASLAGLALSKQSGGFDENYRENTWMWFNGAIFVVAMLTTTRCANLITRDSDRGNRDFLRSTLLSPLRILAGKFGAGVVELVPPIAAIGVAALPFFFAEEPVIPLIIFGYGAMAMTVAISLLGSLLVSTLVTKTNAAIVGAVLLNTFMLGGYIFISVAVEVATFNRVLANDVIDRIVWFSPVLSQFMVAETYGVYFFYGRTEADFVQAWYRCAASQAAVVALLVVLLILANTVRTRRERLA